MTYLVLVVPSLALGIYSLLLGMVVQSFKALVIGVILGAISLICLIVPLGLMTPDEASGLIWLILFIGGFTLLIGFCISWTGGDDEGGPDDPPRPPQSPSPNGPSTDKLAAFFCLSKLL